MSATCLAVMTRDSNSPRRICRSRAWSSTWRGWRDDDIPGILPYFAPLPPLARHRRGPRSPRPPRGRGGGTGAAGEADEVDPQGDVDALLHVDRPAERVAPAVGEATQPDAEARKVGEGGEQPVLAVKVKPLRGGGKGGERRQAVVHNGRRGTAG